MRKKITIYDIANETGFSVGTVNRALNDKARISPATKKLIIDTAKRLGYKVNPAAQGLRRTPITIGAILFCPVEEYVDSIINGISAAAGNLEKYNVTVDIKKIDFTNRNDCLTKAMQLIKLFSDNGYDGIILHIASLIDELGELTELINELSQKKIYFATVASDIPNCNRTIYVGVNAFMAGKMAAEMLEMSCAGRDIAILVGSTFSTINMEYVKGFLEYSKNNIFSNISIYEHYDDKEKVIDATSVMLKENPALRGVYMATASSATACNYIKKLNRDNLSIITTDLLKETSCLLTQRVATATIFQNPYEQGKNVTKLLYNHILQKKDAGIHLITPHILLSSNLTDYISNKDL